jgi:lipopolysaccharide transport system permease protein
MIFMSAKREYASIYTPDSQLRSAGSLFRAMWRDLIASRELAWRLTVRDINAKYRQSLLGLLWAVFNPLATALVFILLSKSKVLNVGNTSVPYPVYIMFGTTLWQAFVESLNAPLGAITASKAILAKVNFPREALILSGLGQTLFNLGIKLILLAGVSVIYKVPLTWSTLLALFAILVLIILGTTIGIMLTPIGLLYSDVTQALALITSLWFFVTPVVYTPPNTFPFTLLAAINPVNPILNGARDLATVGVLHDPASFFMVTAIMLVALMISWVVFRLSIPIMVERMSA